MTSFEISEIESEEKETSKKNREREEIVCVFWSNNNNLIGHLGLFQQSGL